jgi:ribosomal protein S18 acetylase RimI-like enzyme
VTTKIRPLRKSDKTAVMAIVKTTLEFDQMDKKVAEELIDAYLENSTGSGYHLLVAEADSSVSGYICYGPTSLTEDAWDIYWIAVAREKQGRGLGSALLTTTEANIKKAKGRMILIDTESHASYEKTRRFYTGHGYKVVCDIPDFYKVGHGKLVYQKLLKPHKRD